MQGLDYDRTSNSALCELVGVLERSNSNSKDFLSKKSRLLKVAKGYIKKINYEVKFDIVRLDSQIQCCFASLIGRYRFDELVKSKDYSRALLKDTQRALRAIVAFLSCPETAHLLKFDANPRVYNGRLGACVLGLLNSGSDTASRPHRTLHCQRWD